MAHIIVVYYVVAGLKRMKFEKGCIKMAKLIKKEATVIYGIVERYEDTSKVFEITLKSGGDDGEKEVFSIDKTVKRSPYISSFIEVDKLIMIVIDDNEEIVGFTQSKIGSIAYEIELYRKLEVEIPILLSCLEDKYWEGNKKRSIQNGIRKQSL